MSSSITPGYALRVYGRQIVPGLFSVQVKAQYLTIISVHRYRPQRDICDKARVPTIGALLTMLVNFSLTFTKCRLNSKPSPWKKLKHNENISSHIADTYNSQTKISLQKYLVVKM